MNDQQLDWWGYLHTDGSIHPKRYFGDQRDIQDAEDSDFVDIVWGPFKAMDREAAMAELQQRYKNLQ
jgi:hypothetical protein